MDQIDCYLNVGDYVNSDLKLLFLPNMFDE